MRGRSAQLGTSPEALVRTLRTALSLSQAMPSQFSVAQVNALRRVTEGFQELFPPSSEYPLEGECDESADEELTLDKMPTEMIVRILLCLPTSDIGTMDCVCRAFHGERPTPTLPSPIEQALRERAVLRGEILEVDRPKGGVSWTQSLCWRERLITLPRNVVAAGWSHLACVTAEGKLLTCGTEAPAGDTSIAVPGALGPGGRVKKLLVLTPVPAFLDQRVHSVAAGYGHTVVLTEMGEVFTCGNGANGLDVYHTIYII